MSNYKINWIVDECICDSPEKFQELQTYIKSIGDVLGKSTANFNKLECCLASLSTARNNGFYEGNYYKVSNYINYIHEWYLNSDCLFLPFGLLKKDIIKNQIFEKFRYSDKLFIKSDSGFKLLTGFSIKKSEWNKELSFLNLSKDDMILISSHKDIEKEYRFWVINNEIITWSSYSWDGADYDSHMPSYLYDTAKTIANQIKLNAFTLDLCLLKSSFRPFVVEINNIYTSGLYNCDYKKLINCLREFEINNFLEQVS